MLLNGGESKEVKVLEKSWRNWKKKSTSKGLAYIYSYAELNSFAYF